MMKEENKENLETVAKVETETKSELKKFMYGIAKKGDRKPGDPNKQYKEIIVGNQHIKFDAQRQQVEVFDYSEFLKSGDDVQDEIDKETKRKNEEKEKAEAEESERRLALQKEEGRAYARGYIEELRKNENGVHVTTDYTTCNTQTLCPTFDLEDITVPPFEEYKTVEAIYPDSSELMDEKQSSSDLTKEKAEESKETEVKPKEHERDEDGYYTIPGNMEIPYAKNREEAQYVLRYLERHGYFEIENRKYRWKGTELRSLAYICLYLQFGNMASNEWKDSAERGDIQEYKKYFGEIEKFEGAMQQVKSRGKCRDKKKLDQIIFDAKKAYYAAERRKKSSREKEGEEEK